MTDEKFVFYNGIYFESMQLKNIGQIAYSIIQFKVAMDSDLKSQSKQM